MKRRLISLLLIIVMVLGLFPAAVHASDNGFIVPVTHNQQVPTGFTGIYTAADLKNISKNLSGSYILMNDIALKGAWDPIGSFDSPFTGIFDGNGYTVSGLKKSWTAQEGDEIVLGLFAALQGAEVRNVAVSGSFSVTVPEDYYDETGKIAIGGIAGYVEDESLINNCVSNVSVSSDERSHYFFTDDISYHGGIAGYAGNSLIQFCRNTGSVTAANFNIGGIVGYSLSTNIYACQNDASITGGFYTGGIVGYARSYSSISSCANTGEILARDSAAGIVSYTNAAIDISDCLNTGRVYSSGGGGLLTDAGILNWGKATVVRCVNVGSASRGSIRNETHGTTVDCYFLVTDDETSHFSGDKGYYTENATGLSAEEMKKRDSFPALPFGGIWTLDKGMEYPFPTALMGLACNNTYKEAYVEKTFEDINEGDRFVHIMGGSGAGSMAGLLSEAYEDAGLHIVNKGWTGINYLNDAMNLDLEITNDFDVLLADLLMSAEGKDLYDRSVEDAMLANLSDLTTHVSTSFNAVTVAQAEGIMKSFADLPSAMSSKGNTLVTDLRKIIGKTVNAKNIESAASTLGTAVSLASKTYDSVVDMADFFVLGNTYTDASKNFSQILKDTASASHSITSNTGKAAFFRSAVTTFTNDMTRFANDDPTLFYEKMGGELADLGTVGLNAAADLAMSVCELNPIIAVKSGLGYGVLVGDMATNMDSVTYYGTMLDMAGYMSKCLHSVVSSYEAAFLESGTYEDAVAYNTALDLYLSLQILSCDYAIGYCTALSSSMISTAFKLNYDDIAASVQILSYKADLEQLREKGKNVHLDADGGISGFIASCPVTVIVEDQSGKELAKLETKKQTLAKNCFDCYGIMGKDMAEKFGFYDPNKHTVRIVGQSKGTMDLILFTGNGGILTDASGYVDLPVSKDKVYRVDGAALSSGGKTVAPTDTYKNPCPFTDVTEADWFYDAVAYAYENGLMNGTGNNLFNPTGLTSRAMIVTILYRLEGSPKSSGKNPFTDVASGTWYTDAVIWAAEKGVVDGYGNGKFGPNDEITREQMATILYKYSKFKGDDVSAKADLSKFADHGQISDWAKTQLSWANAKGLITGRSATSIAPTGKAMRSEAATILQRFCTMN